MCSPKEIRYIRKEVGKNFIIVTPGIRLESNIKSDDQKRVETPKKAIDLGANYLVIGRPITKSKNPLKVLKEINKTLFKMIIKICGIQNEDTLICCEKNSVNFFGMIFYPKSPRNISIENANKLQKKSENLNINGVGVFVNKNINELEEIIKNLKLKFVQLHGSEDEIY